MSILSARGQKNDQNLPAVTILKCFKKLYGIYALKSYKYKNAWYSFSPMFDLISKAIMRLVQKHSCKISVVTFIRGFDPLNMLSDLCMLLV